MADTKLSALTELAATPADTDEVYIRDVSEAAAAESKRITIANLMAAIIAHAASHKGGGSDAIDVAGAAHGLMSSTDKTKLDGIDTGAKDDQTGAEIKTAYQAEANAYTDTKNTKLAGIATGADVTGSNSPQAHKASHQNAGGDELGVAGLSGLLADDQHVLDAEVTAVAIAKTLLTTAGDIIKRGAAAPERLAIGSADDILTVSGGLPVWAAPAGGGVTFTELAGGEDKTDAGSTWQDWDISAIVPAGTTAALIEIRVTGVSARLGGARKNGSARARNTSIGGNTQRVLLTEVDANRVIEVYSIGTSDLSFNVVGYWS